MACKEANWTTGEGRKCRSPLQEYAKNHNNLKCSTEGWFLITSLTSHLLTYRVKSSRFNKTHSNGKLLLLIHQTLSRVSTLSITIAEVVKVLLFPVGCEWITLIFCASSEQDHNIHQNFWDILFVRGYITGISCGGLRTLRSSPPSQLPEPSPEPPETWESLCPRPRVTAVAFLFGGSTSSRHEHACQRHTCAEDTSTASYTDCPQTGHCL